MRTLLSLALLTSILSIGVASPVSADPPVVVLPEIRITASGPEAFTTIARARVEHREDELRAPLAREVPRTVRHDPF